MLSKAGVELGTLPKLTLTRVQMEGSSTSFSVAPPTGNPWRLSNRQLRGKSKRTMGKVDNERKCSKYLLT